MWNETDPAKVAPQGGYWVEYKMSDIGFNNTFGGETGDFWTKPGWEGADDEVVRFYIVDGDGDPDNMSDQDRVTHVWFPDRDDSNPMGGVMYRDQNGIGRNVHGGNHTFDDFWTIDIDTFLKVGSDGLVTQNSDRLINDPAMKIDGQTAQTITPMGNFPPICFARGTLIDTETGPVAVEDLQPGTMIRTRDNGLQPIRWIGSRNVALTGRNDSPTMRPIRIQAGALGKDTPSRDLLVSPQHRVLVRSAIARRMFGTDEVLVAARQLLALDGIEVAEDLDRVEYFHILFDRHEVVFSNGAETESLYPGPQALRMVGRAAVEEILTLFPELRNLGEQPEPARPMIAGRQGRQMADRHGRNDKLLIN